MKPRTRTLADVAVTNLRHGGMKAVQAHVKGAQAVSYIWALALARDKLGHWPDQVEYAEYWKMSERSVQREWTLVKQVFPGEQSPRRLAEWLYAQHREELDSSAVALTAPAPPDLVLA